MSRTKELSSKKLNACAKAASKQAVRNAKENNVSYTVQEGRNIVQHRADGTKKVISTLPKAYVKPAAKSYRVA
jgi:hypothetical protein